MATGGFSTENQSIGAFSTPIQWTVIVFMIIAATNFSFHYYFISKGKFEYFKDIEFRVYIFIIVSFGIIFFINNSYSNITPSENGNTFTDSFFNSVSLLTTTGYGTADFEQWPSLSKVLIFILFFIGGCAGSTTGGMKIIRSILVWKYLVAEIRKLIHPHGVFPVKVANSTVPDEVVKSTLGYYLFYILIFISSAIVFSATGQSFETSLTAAASAIGNIGPGLGDIGPSENWSHFHPVAMWVASFCMLLGRLEIFTVMVLFSRTFWRK